MAMNSVDMDIDMVELADRADREQNDKQQKAASGPVRIRFTISELADEFGVTHRAIRFYEDRGLLRPERRGLRRLFSRRDRARLALILRGKRLGFSLTDIRELLDLYDLGDGQEQQLRRALERSRVKIEELKRQKQDVEDAIADLDEGLGLLETYLRLRAEGQTRQSFDQYLKTANPERWQHFSQHKPQNSLSNRED